MLKELWEFVKGMLSNDRPESCGRSGTIFVVYFLVVWECYIVSKTASITDIPYGWITLVTILWGGSCLKEGYVKGKEVSSASAAPATPQG